MTPDTVKLALLMGIAERAAHRVCLRALVQCIPADQQASYVRIVNALRTNEHDVLTATMAKETAARAAAMFDEAADAILEGLASASRPN